MYDNAKSGFIAWVKENKPKGPGSLKEWFEKYLEVRFKHE